MLRRVLTGASLLAATLGAWWVDASRPGEPAWALTAFGVVLSLGALRELLAMGGASAPQRRVGLVVGVLWMAVMVLAGLAAGGHLHEGDVQASWAGPLRATGDVLTAASAVASLLLVSRIATGPGRGVVRLARSLWFCVPYVLGLSSLVALLLSGRLPLVVGVVLTAKSSDIGAYFAGKSFGRRKLAPSISPGKTVEGLVGGLALPAVVAAFLLDGVVLGESGAGPVPVPGGAVGAAAHGLVLGVLTVLSDLAESLLKRSCEVKDSGTLFGESGGFLDLADSLLLVAPLVLAYTAVAS